LRGLDKSGLITFWREKNVTSQWLITLGVEIVKV